VKMQLPESMPTTLSEQIQLYITAIYLLIENTTVEQMLTALYKYIQMFPKHRDKLKVLLCSGCTFLTELEKIGEKDGKREG